MRPEYELPAQDNAAAQTFKRAVASYREEGLNAVQALQQAAKHYPASYKAWKAAGGTTGFPEPDDGRPETYEKAVRFYEKIEGRTKAASYRQAARTLPKAHEAWKAAHPVPVR